MKIKHIYKLYFSILALAIVMGCSPDEPAKLEISHSVVASSLEQAIPENILQINKEISFADLSSGVVSRLWQVTGPGLPSDEDVIYVKKLDKNVSNIEEIKAIIDNEEASDEEIEEAEAQLRIGNQNIIPDFKEDIIKLEFLTAGVYTVSLTQEFEDFPFVGDGTEVLDTKEVVTEFEITVLERVLISNVKGVILDEDSNPAGDVFSVKNDGLQDVEAGIVVRYTFDITGNADGFTAESDNAVLIDGSESLVDGKGMVEFKYSSIGTYDLSIEATRSEPEAQNTKAFTQAINVIPSTKPVTLDNAVISDNGVSVELVFSRELDESTVNANDFSVTLKDKNDADLPGISITDVDVKSGDNTTLVVTLGGERAYDGETLRITYTPGTLTSSDFTTVLQVEGVSVKASKIMYDAGGFENAAGVDWFSDSRGGGIVEIVPTPLAVNSSGNVLNLRAETTGNVRPRAKTVNPVDFDAGVQYRIRYKRYIPSTSGLTGQFDRFRILPLDRSFNSWNDAGVVLDIWQEFEAIIDSPGVSVQIELRTTPGEPHNVYYEDLVVELIEERP